MLNNPVVYICTLIIVIRFHSYYWDFIYLTINCPNNLLVVHCMEMETGKSNILDECFFRFSYNSLL